MTVHAEVLRAGRRLRLVDVTLAQDGAPVARARGLFLADPGPAVGKMWAPDHKLAVPPVALRPTRPDGRLYVSESSGWSAHADPHGNADRKQIWATPIQVVAGEEPTPFQLAAGLADLASVVSQWGSEGLSFINADISLSLARLPITPEMNVATLDGLPRAA